jgi:hypothetical protein
VTASDILGFLLFYSYGFWLLLAPASVIKFYNCFHDEYLRRHPSRAIMPKPLVLRILGLLWLVILTLAVFFSRRHM